MSPAQLHILRHSLGLDDRGHGRQYRNHYCAGPGHHGFDDCRKLVADGLMTERPPSQLTGGDHLFMVTDKGKAAVLEAKEPEPKLTRDQKRYRDYLHSEVNLTFGEWLKWRQSLKAEVAHVSP